MSERLSFRSMRVAWAIPNDVLRICSIAALLEEVASRHGYGEKNCSADKEPGAAVLQIQKYARERKREQKS